MKNSRYKEGYTLLSDCDTMSHTGNMKTEQLLSPRSVAQEMRRRTSTRKSKYYDSMRQERRNIMVNKGKFSFYDPIANSSPSNSEEIESKRDHEELPSTLGQKFSDKIEMTKSILEHDTQPTKNKSSVSTESSKNNRKETTVCII